MYESTVSSAGNGSRTGLNQERAFRGGFFPDVSALMRRILPSSMRIGLLQEGQERCEYTITCCIDVKTISTEQCGHVKGWS
jgi:hypothetical protein